MTLELNITFINWMLHFGFTYLLSVPQNFHFSDINKSITYYIITELLRAFRLVKKQWCTLAIIHRVVRARRRQTLNTELKPFIILKFLADTCFIKEIHRIFHGSPNILHLGLLSGKLMENAVYCLLSYRLRNEKLVKKP